MKYSSGNKFIEPGFSNKKYIEYLQSNIVPVLKTDNFTKSTQQFYIKDEDFDQTNFYLKLAYKSGDKSDCANYRPIIFMNRKAKVRDFSVASWIGTIVPQIPDMIYLMKQYINQYKDKIILILDIKNAFGSVCIELLKKIIDHEKINEYLDYLYKDKIINFVDEKYKWQNGLYQGLSSSMGFFIIYINSALELIRPLCIKIINYVDDILIVIENDINIYKKIIGILKEFNLHINEKSRQVSGDVGLPQADSRTTFLGAPLPQFADEYILHFLEDFKLKLNLEVPRMEKYFNFKSMVSKALCFDNNKHIKEFYKICDEFLFNFLSIKICYQNVFEELKIGINTLDIVLTDMVKGKKKHASYVMEKLFIFRDLVDN
jgi:hypothetical protein